MMRREEKEKENWTQLIFDVSTAGRFSQIKGQNGLILLSVIARIVIVTIMT